VKAGKITGYSVGGMAVRVSAPMPDGALRMPGEAA
jgi:hypothetical protein